MKEPLMRTVRDTYKLWTEYMKSIAADVGIPDSYRLVLTFLLRHPGASQKDIAGFRSITTASVSKIVTQMELTGYLKREADIADQRYVRLYLTDKGADCARQMHERLVLADERITQLLTPEREEQIISAMHELANIIEKELTSV